MKTHIPHHKIVQVTYTRTKDKQRNAKKQTTTADSHDYPGSHPGKSSRSKSSLRAPLDWWNSSQLYRKTEGPYKPTRKIDRWMFFDCKLSKQPIIPYQPSARITGTAPAARVSRVWKKKTHSFVKTTQQSEKEKERKSTLALRRKKREKKKRKKERVTRLVASPTPLGHTPKWVDIKPAHIIFSKRRSAYKTRKIHERKHFLSLPSLSTFGVAVVVSSRSEFVLVTAVCQFKQPFTGVLPLDIPFPKWDVKFESQWTKKK